MIAWSIEAAKTSEVFDRIFVSTDDLEIAEVSLKYGAEVPFIRPENLSDDYVGTTEVVAHAVSWAESSNMKISAACCVYATAPLLDPEDIVRGLEMLESGGWDYTFSVTDFNAPIFRAFRQTEQGGVEMFFPDFFKTRSQDLPHAFHDAAQFYWGRSSAWLEQKKIFDLGSMPIFIPRDRVQDIDTLNDWSIAEQLFKVKLKG
jgi:N-acylneuraminate cytidylyltransferase